MLKKILFLTLLGVSGAATAQTNFRPGYVLTLAGDTLRGEVDARGAVRNARLARFRPTPAAAVVEYQPRQLSGYGVIGGRRYQTETVVLNDSLQQVTLMDARVDSLPRPVFLEVVVQGSLSLYALEDRRVVTHYYLRGTNGQLLELSRTMNRVVGNKALYDSGIKPTYKVGAQASYNQASQAFRYTLQAATQQCPAVQPAITKVPFKLQALAQVVQRYNECVGAPQVTSTASLPHSRVRLTLLAGGGGSRLNLTDNRFFQDARSITTAALRPVGGLGMQLPLTKITPNLALRLEALYHAQRHESEVVTGKYGSGTGARNYQYRTNLQSLRFPLMVRYTYPTGQIRPFVQGGYGVSYLLNNTAEVRRVYETGQTPLPNQEWERLAARRLETGFLGSIGVQTARAGQRNLGLELRLERTNGFTNSIGVGTTITRYMLLLSYELAK